MKGTDFFRSFSFNNCLKESSCQLCELKVYIISQQTLVRAPAESLKSLLRLATYSGECETFFNQPLKEKDSDPGKTVNHLCLEYSGPQQNVIVPLARCTFLLKTFDRFRVSFVCTPAPLKSTRIHTVTGRIQKAIITKMPVVGVLLDIE